MADINRKDARPLLRPSSALAILLTLATVAILVQSRAAEICRNSVDCERAGLCTARLLPLSHQCIATSELDCMRSFGCDDHARCRLQGNSCTLSAEGCRRWHGCLRKGLCTQNHGECIATGKDCHHLQSCRKHRRCEAENGVCP